MTGHRERGLRADAVRQRVRRYPRDDLLRGIGRVASQEATAKPLKFQNGACKWARVREGYLLLLAGVCVTRCNNHRSGRVTDHAVGELVDDVHNIWDPGLDGPDVDEALRRTLSRTFWVQMPFQNEPWPPLMRTLCLYGDDPQFGPSAISGTQWSKIVGVSLGQFLQIGFLMYVAALRNGGAIDRAVLDPDRFDQIVPPLTIAEVLETADVWLTKPAADLAALGRANSPDEDDLWAFNPFFEYPVALLDDGTYVMPSPLGVLQRLSPQGVYFIVRDAIKNGLLDTTHQHFSDALGSRFERYIGAQLHRRAASAHQASQRDHLRERSKEERRLHHRDPGGNRPRRSEVDSPRCSHSVRHRSRHGQDEPDADEGMQPDNAIGRHDRTEARQVPRQERQAAAWPDHHPRALLQPARGVHRQHDAHGVSSDVGVVITTLGARDPRAHRRPRLRTQKRLLEALAPDTERLYSTADPLRLGHNPAAQGPLGAMANHLAPSTGRYNETLRSSRWVNKQRGSVGHRIICRRLDVPITVCHGGRHVVAHKEPKAGG